MNAYSKQLEIIEVEKLYRKNDSLNYSAIKDFDVEGPLAFYKKHISKEKVSERKSDAMDMGNLIDCLLTSPDTFDKRYFIYDGNSPIVGQNKELVDELFKITKTNYNDALDIVEGNFEDRFKEAFDNIRINKQTGEIVKFKGKVVEDILGKFHDGEMEVYYDSLLENINKKVVMRVQLELAEAIKRKILDNKHIYQIFKPQDPNIEVHTQFPLYFEYMDLKMKGLCDIIHINHKEGWVQEHDLKTSYSVNDFSYNRFNNRYYIQEGVYHIGLVKTYGGYEIRPRKYIIADSTNQADPYIALTTMEHVNEAYNGFTTKNGNTYRGLDQLLDDIRFHFNRSNWNSSRELIENEGIITLNLIGNG